MIRPALAFLLAAGVGGAWSGPEQAKPDVRIFASLEEAAPSRGGAVLLVFFSTTCVVCYDDLLESRFMVEKSGWPVAVVGVHLGPYEDLLAFLEKYRWDLPVVLDRRKHLFRKFQVTAVPDKALLVGEDVVHRDDPYRDHGQRREELRQCLEGIFGRGNSRSSAAPRST